MPFLIVLALITPTVGCSKKITDDYGYERPKDCWLTECLLLPVNPVDAKSEYTEWFDEDDIALSELFGTVGESGIVSEKALSLNGQIKEDGTAYIVYLICATGDGVPEYGSSVMGSSYSLAYSDGARVLHGTGLSPQVSASGDFFAEGSADLGGNLHINVKADEDGMTYATKKPQAVSDGAACGAIVISVDLGSSTEGGVLGVNLGLQPSENIADEAKYVVTEHIFRLGQSAVEVEAEIVKELRVGYMSKQDYDADKDIHDTTYWSDAPVFADGEECYAILTFSVAAKADNAGDGMLRLIVFVDDTSTLELWVESAPTDKLETVSTAEGDAVYASFGVPETAGKEKSVTVVVRLRPLLADCSTGIHVFVTGAGSTKISGSGYHYNTAKT